MGAFRRLPFWSGPAGLLVFVTAGMATAAVVSLLLIFVLPGAAGSVDRLLPQNGPLSTMIASVVPFVWIGLFAALGAAFWLVRRQPSRPGAGAAAKELLGLLALCVAYPILFSGTRAIPVAILGNAVVICAAVVCGWLCRSVSRLAAALVSLVAIWAVVATAALVALFLGLPL